MTLLIGVDSGIIVGLFLSLLLVVKHTTLPHITLLGQIDDGTVVILMLTP